VTSDRCAQSDDVLAHALHALPVAEVMGIEAHIASCEQCREEFVALRRTTEKFASWPTDVLRPSTPLRERLARRIAEDTGSEVVIPPHSGWAEPPWRDVAPGIACKLLATDERRSLVSRLVRLDPGAAYPAHIHADVEELHLLEGELWIDERKLYPGDYNRGEPGMGDKHVWSETGCTCVLITSIKDTLL
jgi:quercetin dioxygenase-like cupin family protein